MCGAERQRFVNETKIYIFKAPGASAAVITKVMILLMLVYYTDLDARKQSSGSAKNKDTDQPALPRRLISAFFIRSLESIVYQLATTDISIF